MENHYIFMKEAIKEAKKSLKEGGIPIGAVLVREDKIIGHGHNKLLQNSSTILHGEMDCIENSGILRGEDYQNSTLYTTLSPCEMCSGMILFYKIPKVFIGENETLRGPEEYLRENNVELINLDLVECKELMRKYIRENQETWNREIERVTL